METIEITGHLREKLGKQNSNHLRVSAHIPCVMYGDEKEIHFYIHMSEAKKIVYTPNVYFINLKIDNKAHRTILQDTQFHPVSEMIMHMDFLKISDDKEIKLMVPIECKGESPGVKKGGLLTKKIRKLKIKGYPQKLPSRIQVDVSKLDLGGSAKIKEIDTGGEYQILMSANIPVATVIVPRALKSKQEAAAK